MTKERIQIGHVELDVNPQQFAIFDFKLNSVGGTMRNTGTQAMPSGYSDMNIQMSVMFPNRESINRQLREIIALSKASPMLSVKSKYLADIIHLSLKRKTSNNKKENPYPYESHLNDIINEWANIIFAYYVLPRVKLYIDSKESTPEASVSVIARRLKLRFVEPINGNMNLLDKERIIESSGISARELAQKIVEDKWSYNYIVMKNAGSVKLLEDKDIKETYTKKQVLDLLKKNADIKINEDSLLVSPVQHAF